MRRAALLQYEVHPGWKPRGAARGVRGSAPTHRDVFVAQVGAGHPSTPISSCGVLHRDLKPANILLDQGGRPYVADFGLARPLHGDSGLTQTGALVGTPSYMAPEQTTGDRAAVTTAADVYGVGGILYALLTGGPPFTAASVYETITLVRERVPERPSRRRPGIDRDLETICLKCLAKAPAQRYASAEALAEDLERWLAGVPIRARRAGAVERLSKWARRRPGLAVLAVVCFLLLGGLVGAAAVYEWRLREALHETAAQKERASANYREARAALRQILERAAARSSSAVPRLRELQRAQEEDALAFFLKIAEQQSDDPEVRLDAALARFEVGILQARLGDQKAALPNLHAARDTLDALTNEFPQHGRYRYEHTRVLLILSTSGMSSRAETESHLTQALEQTERLLAMEPEKPDYLAARAATYLLLGNLHQGDQPKQAEAHLVEAAALWRLVSQAQSNVRKHRLRLADTWANLSLLRQQHGGDAGAAHQQAEALLEQLHGEAPDDDEAMDSLAALRVNWAYWQINQGQAEAALKALAKNVQMLEPALKNEPHHVTFRDRLASAAVTACADRIFAQQRRFAEAVPEQRRVVELCATPAEADYHRLFLALSHANAGQHVAAAAVIDDWTTRTTAQTPPDQVLHAVGVYCAAVTAARRDKALSVAERDTCAERHGKQAVALLQGLADRGYFRDPAHAKVLTTDLELLPLHGRTDFAKLLSQVKVGAK